MDTFVIVGGSIALAVVGLVLVAYAARGDERGQHRQPRRWFRKGGQR